MTNRSDSTQGSLPYVIGYGALRSSIVNTFTYPLEVIKTHQQTGVLSLAGHQVALQLLEKDGIKGFYKGFAPHFIKGIVRQTLWWPSIVYIPPFLGKRSFTPFQQCVITGLGIASMDAMLNSPLERWRVLAITGNNNERGKASRVSDGWKGSFPYMRRQWVTWTLFLIGQRHFNKPYKQENEAKQLALPQVLSTACKLSLIASLAINPFDTLNTIRQGGSDRKISFLKVKDVAFLYRGFPVNFLINLIQTSGTVFVIDLIETQLKWVAHE